MKKFMIFLSIILHAYFSNALAAQRVGTGGDPLEGLSIRGKEFALKIIKTLEQEYFAENFSQQKWLVQNKNQIYQDLNESKIVWVSSLKQPKCAMTFVEPRAPIQFSFERCRPSMHNELQAAEMFIHETLHHFGIGDESDLIAAHIIKSITLNPVFEPVRRTDATKTGWMNLFLSPQNEVMAWTSPEDFLIHGTGLLKLNSSGQWITVQPRSELTNLEEFKNKYIRDVSVITMNEETMLLAYNMMETTYSGAIYDVTQNSLKPLPNEPELDGRRGFTSLWTGEELLIWGGYKVSSKDTTSVPAEIGLRYSPRLKQWKKMGEKSKWFPTPRYEHLALWTGKKLVIWGGSSTKYFRRTPLCDGAMYDPATDQWTPLPTPAWEVSSCIENSIAWTGKQVLLWGGRGAGGEGALYDIESQQWTPIKAAPENRKGHTAIMIGDKMLVVGGRNESGNISSTFLIYDMISDLWDVFAHRDIVGKTFTSSAWTGNQLVLMGPNLDRLNEVREKHFLPLIFDGVIVSPFSFLK